ncbi:MAG: glycosyltransferase family 87 protein [Actinomycetota bacterium]
MQSADPDAGAAQGLGIISGYNSTIFSDDTPLHTEDEVIEIARGNEKIINYLEDRPDATTGADFGEDKVWTVSFYSGWDEIARVLIDDSTGAVTETMTGPQVAWQMARGYKGAFGRIVNEPYVWITLCLLFLLPFIDVKNPFRLLNLDLVMLLSFSVSHYFFNEGEIYRSVPLVYPPLVYLFARLFWLGCRRQRSYSRITPPAATAMPLTREPELRVPEPHLNFSNRVMIAGLALLIVFRIVINIADSNVVDVGYSGVIGADLIMDGSAPYGNMPDDNGNGDTYGPLNYLLYIPFETALPWSGEWDELPAAHAAAIFFDLLCLAGLFMAGRLIASGTDFENRLGIALAYGWAAFPYTTFVQNCNVNDAIVAAFIIWGFVLLYRLPLAGLMLGFATQIKFFPAILGPLWASFPRAWRGWKSTALFVLAFTAGVAVALPVIFLGDGTIALFLERSIKWQAGRDSPFSIWGQYPERLADVQRVGQYVLAALAVGAYFWPPRKNLIQVAAASAALIVGFQIMQTHWFYLYIPWFFPLALIALLLGGRNSKAPALPAGSLG